MKRGADVESFGTQLSNVRRAKGITQEQLAERLAVSRTNISRWESGKLMPDLDIIKRLSQILEFNFFTVEGLSGGAPEASLAKKPPKKRNVRRLILAAAGAVLLLAAAFAGLRLAGRMSGGKPKANVLITPTENPVYAIRSEADFRGGVGWFYEFRYDETAGVPFTIDELIITVTADNGEEYNNSFTREDVIVWYGSATIEKGRPQTHMGGFPVDQVRSVRLTLKGTDANGNALTFSGETALSKEIKGTAAQFGGTSGDVFSVLCGMQTPRFTSSKPSKFAFASDEKSIRRPTTSFVRRCPKRIARLFGDGFCLPWRRRNAPIDVCYERTNSSERSRLTSSAAQSR